MKQTIIQVESDKTLYHKIGFSFPQGWEVKRHSAVNLPKLWPIVNCVQFQFTQTQMYTHFEILDLLSDFVHNSKHIFCLIEIAAPQSKVVQAANDAARWRVQGDGGSSNIKMINFIGFRFFKCTAFVCVYTTYVQYVVQCTWLWFFGSLKMNQTDFWLSKIYG